MPGVKMALSDKVVANLLKIEKLEKENERLYWELAAYQEFGKEVATRNGENKKGKTLKKQLKGAGYKTNGKKSIFYKMLFSN